MKFHEQIGWVAFIVLVMIIIVAFYQVIYYGGTANYEKIKTFESNKVRVTIEGGELISGTQRIINASYIGNNTTTCIMRIGN